MPDANIEILKKETYLKAIENSIGTRLFNSVFVKFKDTGAEKDILNDGEYSCAFFVSSILFLFNMLDKTHTTVKTVREKLDTSERWKKTDGEVVPGDIVFWEKVQFPDGSENEHVGFVINGKEAVSTSYKTKTVVRHSVDLPDEAGEKRKITAIFRHSFQ